VTWRDVPITLLVLTPLAGLAGLVLVAGLDLVRRPRSTRGWPHALHALPAVE
jgi:hypothetical protein